MFEVSVSSRFTAAHQLRLASGEYEPLHDHDWRVSVTLAGESLDEMGVLFDFTVIKPRLDELLCEFQSRNLNRVGAFREVSPSAENVAALIAGRLGADLPDRVNISFVEVEEAPGCLARFWPNA